jgi:hypothetical protein
MKQTKRPLSPDDKAKLRVAVGQLHKCVAKYREHIAMVHKRIALAHKQIARVDKALGDDVKAVLERQWQHAATMH